MTAITTDSADATTCTAWHLKNAAGTYLVSTSQQYLDLGFINQAFSTEDMYWAKPLPVAQLQLLLSQSDTLGLYKLRPPTTINQTGSVERQATQPPTEISSTSVNPLSGSWEQVGLARLISDRVTTAYLTDVYITSEERGSGLGKWLIACCKEIIDAMPALRRAVLVATPDVQEFYARELGFWDVHDERENLTIMTKKGYKAPGGSAKTSQA